MKTINEALDEAYKRSGENAYFGSGFNAGIEFAQQWISIEEELPENKSFITESKNNRNKHLHGIKYFLKGYYNDNTELVGYECGEYFPGSVCYFFLRPNNFTVTHWRPVERV